MKGNKEPLYRKHNKLAMGYHHNSLVGDFRHDRNRKAMVRFEGTHKAMRRSREGYDYTPLFKFLLSKVGQKWNDIFSEVIQRIDKQEPVFRLVYLDVTGDDTGVIGIGESSYFSKLTVKDGILVKANEHAVAPAKRCTCCTHSFNGKPY